MDKAKILPVYGKYFEHMSGQVERRNSRWCISKQQFEGHDYDTKLNATERRD
jgi:hypothetical protein